MSKTKATATRSQPLYRVKNWAAYDQALVQRGSLTFWLSDDFEQVWCAERAPQRGAPRTYSDRAIEIMLTLKAVFHLTNRGVEGFVRSVFQLLGLDLPVPDHTTLSKRSQTLTVNLPTAATGAVTLVLDSTGLKVYGEGEWKMRKHGKSKRRTWRKLHLAVNALTGEVVATELTTNGVGDAQVVPDLLAALAAALEACAADGAYDTRATYAALTAHSPDIDIRIPPRRGACIWQHGNSAAPPLPRDQNLRAIRAHGRRQWKQEAGYHVRSLAETAVFRLKTIFGDHLSARLLATQTTQVRIRCAALNRMTSLGMPESYLVA